MAGMVYKIRFRQGDLEFEVEGDKNYVNRIYSDFKPLTGLTTGRDAGKPATGGKRANTTDTSTMAKSASPREFLDRFGVKRHVDVVLAFGYFLEEQRGLKGFTSVDINTCYYEAKIEPSNTSQMIINNIKKGFMMQAPKSGKKKMYTLTRTGQQFIEAGFRKQKAE